MALDALLGAIRDDIAELLYHTNDIEVAHWATGINFDDG